jgi:hypothetical protein
MTDAEKQKIVDVEDALRTARDQLREFEVSRSGTGVDIVNHERGRRIEKIEELREEEK